MNTNKNIKYKEIVLGHTEEEDVKENIKDVVLRCPVTYKRIYSIPNYIPHNIPRVTDRRLWHYTYLEYIKDLYYITMKLIKKNYPRFNIRWKNKDLFNEFSLFLYTCSSKHISPYV